MRRIPEKYEDVKNIREENHNVRMRRVSRLDDLDAKMAQVTSAIENEPGESDWTAWKNQLGTRLYRKRVIE